jgi:hypothetical protein
VRDVLGDLESVQLISRGQTLVLQGDSVGAPVVMDRRGRIALPAWLRRAAGMAASRHRTHGRCPRLRRGPTTQRSSSHRR